MGRDSLPERTLLDSAGTLHWTIVVPPGSSCNADLRVMPERILPQAVVGVTISSSNTKKTFMAPTSSTYLRSTPSSQRTWL